MERIWLIMVELIGDAAKTPSPSEIGFMNITTWAASKESATRKIKNYLRSFGWHLVSVERADLVNEHLVYGEQVAAMIERTRINPNAIILGTFHTYRPN